MPEYTFQLLSQDLDAEVTGYPDDAPQVRGWILDGWTQHQLEVVDTHCGTTTCVNMVHVAHIVFSHQDEALSDAKAAY